MQKSLKNQLSELPKLVELVERFTTNGRLSTTMAENLNLVFEELFVNIVEHGGGDPLNRSVVVKIERHDDMVIATMADHGAPFNPLKYLAGITKASFRECKVGGFGLCLVRELADDITYSRDGDANVTSVKLRVNNS